METFFDDEDYEFYLRLMREWCDASGIEVWSYCLMPNHVHLIATPEREGSLARGIGETHRRYTRHINFKKGWKGYLWQGRFASFSMDENYLLAACCYVELNPVRAKLCERPEDYRWSSARAHLAGKDDVLVKVQPMLDRVSNWPELLASGDQALFDDMRMHERTGRPLGSEGFMAKMSSIVGRELGKKKPGPKRSVDN
jgi:REP-associated tyrosine transposase